MGSRSRKVTIPVEDESVIKSVAKSFFDSASILGMIAGEFYEDMDSVKMKFKVPQIVLQALAAEIALKADSFNDGKIEKEHNLYKLFELIPQERKDEIKQKAKEIHYELYPNQAYQDEAFEIYLMDIADIYNEWRYVYEKEELEFDFMFFDVFTRAVICK